MRETQHTTKLKKKFEEIPNSITFRPTDKIRYGISDLIFTYRKKTSWIEVKFIGPKGLIDTGIQKRTMQELEEFSFCSMYVIYKQQPRQTCLVLPKNIGRFHEDPTLSDTHVKEEIWNGWVYEEVAEYFWRLHGGDNDES